MTLLACAGALTMTLPVTPKVFVDENHKATIVVVHGNGENPRAMDFVSEEFFKNGLNVIQVLLPGHGTHPKDLEGIALDAFPQAVAKAIREANLLTPNRVYVSGFSFGAAVALVASNETVKGGILFAPSFGPIPIVGQLLQRKMAKLGRDAELDWVSSDRNGYHKITYGIADTLLGRNVEMGKRAIAAPFQAKLTLIKAQKDNYSDPVLLKGFTDSHQCEISELPGSTHSDVLGDKEEFREVIRLKIRQWISDTSH